MRDGGQLDAVQVLDLTTLGRISGLRRTIEIWFVVHQDNVYVLAEHGREAQWVMSDE